MADLSRKRRRRGWLSALVIVLVAAGAAQAERSQKAALQLPKNQSSESEKFSEAQGFAKTPAEAAQACREQYGPDSPLTRGIVTVALIAGAAERGSQLPLDRLNLITGTISESGREILGIETLPLLELRSSVTVRHFGLSVSTRW
ncbi:MAG: hypothetical protein ACE5E4_03845 [Candidatus Binatia bacterium]